MRPRLLATALIPPAVLMALVVLFNIFFAVHSVREHSMEPVLLEGQTILVLRRIWDRRPYTPGDILVFNSPADGIKVVKRCVLVSGDPLDIRHGWIYTARGRFYVSPDQKKHFEGTYEIPQGSFFAVGDNPRQSVDSRTYGFVPVLSVEGRVIFPRKRCPLR